MKERIYKYNYGNEIFIDVELIVYKINVNQYEIYIDVLRRDENVNFPTIETKYDIISSYKKTYIDDEGFDGQKYMMIIETYNHPPPENIVNIVYHR